VTSRHHDGDCERYSFQRTQNNSGFTDQIRDHLLPYSIEKARHFGALTQLFLSGLQTDSQIERLNFAMDELGPGETAESAVQNLQCRCTVFDCPQRDSIHMQSVKQIQSKRISWVHLEESPHEEPLLLVNCRLVI
jgi:hypothetical protein